MGVEGGAGTYKTTDHLILSILTYTRENSV